MFPVFLNIVIVFIAVLHLWFGILEMVYWQKPLGIKLFRLEKEFAKQSAKLAANQGLYNLFLSAGLLLSLVVSNPLEALHLKLFFLSCVLLAGIFAGLTVRFKIFLIQGLPALLVLLCVFLGT